MGFTLEQIKKILRDDPGKTVEGGMDVLSPTPKQNKLRAIKVNLEGFKFDSTLEARRYEVLKLWEQAGIIQNLDLEHKKIDNRDIGKERKHHWLLQEGFSDEGGNRHIRIRYTDDFQYEINGILIIEDIKGRLTAEFRRTEKLFRFKYPHINFFVNLEKDGWFYDES